MLIRSLPWATVFLAMPLVDIAGGGTASAQEPAVMLAPAMADSGPIFREIQVDAERQVQACSPQIRRASAVATDFNFDELHFTLHADDRGRVTRVEMQPIPALVFSFARGEMRPTTQAERAAVRALQACIARVGRRIPFPAGRASEADLVVGGPSEGVMGMYTPPASGGLIGVDSVPLGFGGLAGESNSQVRVELIEVPVPPRPTVQIGNLTVGGLLAVDDVRLGIARSLNPVRRCYESELRSTPALAGDLVVSFVVSTTGLVSNASIASSTMANESIERCIANEVRQMTFPAPETGVVLVNAQYRLRILQIQ